MAYQHLRKMNQEKVNTFCDELKCCTAQVTYVHYVVSVSKHQHCSHKVICPLTAGSLAAATRKRHLGDSGCALQLCYYDSSAL